MVVGGANGLHKVFRLLAGVDTMSAKRKIDAVLSDNDDRLSETDDNSNSSVNTSGSTDVPSSEKGK